MLTNTISYGAAKQKYAQWAMGTLQREIILLEVSGDNKGGRGG